MYIFIDDLKNRIFSSRFQRMTSNSTFYLIFYRMNQFTNRRFTNHQLKTQFKNSIFFRNSMKIASIASFFQLKTHLKNSTHFRI